MSLYAIRCVLASAYRGGRRPCNVTLTHAVLVDADGFPTEPRSLCGRIPEEHLADAFAPTTPEPTCRTCARKVARLKATTLYAILTRDS